MAFLDMRVAIDSGPLESGHKIRGVGFYTKSLISALEKVSKEKGGLKVEAFDFSKEEMRLKTGYYDIIHIPYFNPYILSLPTEKIAKTIVTIHDLIPLVYPLQYVPGIRGKKVFLQQKKLLHTIVDAVITDTESSKKDVVRFFQLPEKNIYPIHLAPGDAFYQINDRKSLSDVQKKYNLPNKFVLYVGDINYNKNIPNLIKACSVADIALVIVGKQASEIDSDHLPKRSKGIRDIIRNIRGVPHPEEAHLQELKKLFLQEKHVFRLGFVSDEDLVQIFNLASVYCQPSLYEGFGLAVPQAFVCGTPVVAARTQALVEVSDDAALFVDPYDVKQMAKQIERLIRDAYLKATLIRRGEKRANVFSWEKTALETLAVYKKVFQDERITARKKNFIP